MPESPLNKCNTSLFKKYKSKATKYTDYFQVIRPMESKDGRGLILLLQVVYGGLINLPILMCVSAGVS